MFLNSILFEKGFKLKLHSDFSQERYINQELLDNRCVHRQQECLHYRSSPHVPHTEQHTNTQSNTPLHAFDQTKKYAP